MRARWRGSVVLAALAAGVWACGSSSSPGGTGGAGSDAGASVDAGVGVDAGSDAGPGGTDGGGSTDGGTGGGGGSTDGGTGGGGSTDGGSGGGGSTDGGTGGGGVAEGCEGVVPDRLGASFSFDVPTPDTRFTCDDATSDESGNVAASVVRGIFDFDSSWHLYDSNGSHLNQVRGKDLWPQGPGYEGLFPDDPCCGSFWRVGAWTPDGKRTNGPAVSSDNSGATGFRTYFAGLLVVSWYCALEPGRFELRLFDPSANQKATASMVGGCARLAGAVGDGKGNLLLMIHDGSFNGFGPDDLIAQWFDSTGKSISGWFRVATLAGGHQFLIRALIGGGAAVRVDGVWTWFMPSGEAKAQPAPQFLLDHPNADFTLVRGAKAYAVLPRSGDTTQVELYSASGNRCGPLKFPQGPLTTGADGSAIASSGDKGCTKTVWPGLLR